ncbi:hypothetical protein CHS0354_038715 [Potamilus streckersoni]|nr:hypothetical protein CHS0354_038715 [Potamilus streckersoni]
MSSRASGSNFRSDADRFTNNRRVDATNKTISSILINDGNYQNLNHSGDESHGHEISTNITTIKHGSTNFESTSGTPTDVCRSRNTAPSKTDSSSSRSGGTDAIFSKEYVPQNVFACPQIFLDATSHNNRNSSSLFGNQGAKSFRSTESSQTVSYSGGKFSSESTGGVGYQGFGISQHQEQSTSVTEQVGTTSSMSSIELLSASMSVDDADQSNNNNPATESFDMTVLRHLTEDENSQIPKQQADGYYEQVDTTTNTTTTQGTNGLGSGFAQPVFGLAATPNQHASFTSGSIPKFDTLALNAPSFGDLAPCGGPAFGNATSFATLPFGTSNMSSRASGSNFRSDADRFTNNRRVDATNKTISSILINDGNYQNLNHSGDESHGHEISTNITTIKHGSTNFESTSGTPTDVCRSRNTAPSKTDSSSSRSGGTDAIFSKEYVPQNVFACPQIFLDATSHNNRNSSSLFGNQGAKSFRSTESSQTVSYSGGKFSSESTGGVGYQGFGISQHQEQSTSVTGQVGTTSSISSIELLSASMSVDDVDQSSNNNPATESFDMTVLRHLTEDENSQIPKQQADGYYEQVDTTTNTTTIQGANGLGSGFAQPVFGLAATPNPHASSMPGFESLVQASNLQSSESTFGSISSFATTTFGTLGSENLGGSGGGTFGSGPSFTAYRS